MEKKGPTLCGRPGCQRRNGPVVGESSATLRVCYFALKRNFKSRTETTDLPRRCASTAGGHRSTQIFLEKAVHRAGDLFVVRNLFLSACTRCGFDSLTSWRQPAAEVFVPPAADLPAGRSPGISGPGPRRRWP